jgi:hypothetical protein
MERIFCCRTLNRWAGVKDSIHRMSVRSTPSLLKSSGFLLFFIFVLFGLEVFMDSIYGLNKNLPSIRKAALIKV